MRPQDMAGPRLEDLKPQSSEYGRPIPLLYATAALQGNVIWAWEMDEDSRKIDNYRIFEYFGTFATSICEGPIVGVTRIWAGSEKRLVYDNTQGLGLIEQAEVLGDGGEPLTFTFYLGTEDQLPDPTMEALMGVGNVPAYRGTAYVVCKNFPLAKDGNRLPYLWYEVTGLGGTGASSGEYTILPQFVTVFDEHSIPWVELYDRGLTAELNPYLGIPVDAGARTNSALSTGKQYFEVTVDSLLGFYGAVIPFINVGIGGLNATFVNALSGINSVTVRVWANNQFQGTGPTEIWRDGVPIAVIGTLTKTDRLGMAVDMDAGLVWFRKNDEAWNVDGSADPATGVGGIPFATGMTVPLAPLVAFFNPSSPDGGAGDSQSSGSSSTATGSDGI